MLNIPIIKTEQLRCTTLIECEDILNTEIPSISLDEIRRKWLHLRATYREDVRLWLFYFVEHAFIVIK